MKCSSPLNCKTITYPYNIKEPSKDLPESSLTPIFEINLEIYKFLVKNVTSILENRYIKIIVQNREIYKQTNRQTDKQKYERPNGLPT